MINNEREVGRLKNISISMVLRITQFLFVDDVLIFGKGNLEEGKVYKDILDSFSNATCMAFSGNKSMFSNSSLEENTLHALKTSFPLK